MSIEYFSSFTFPFEATIDNISGSVHTDHRGTQVTGEASRGDEHMTAELVYRTVVYFGRLG